MLATLCLGLLLSLPHARLSPVGETPPLPTPRLQVAKGSVRIVTRAWERPRTLSPEAKWLAVPGPSYVELGALSELRVCWNGRGSLRVSGPATLELGTVGRGTDERPLAALGSPRAFRVEGRTEGVSLELSGGWVSELDRALLSGRRLPNGLYELANAGARDIHLRCPWLGGKGRRVLRPAQRLRMRLEPPP